MASEVKLSARLEALILHLMSEDLACDPTDTLREAAQLAKRVEEAQTVEVIGSWIEIGFDDDAMEGKRVALVTLEEP